MCDVIVAFAATRHDVQPIACELLATVRDDALGMELDTVVRQLSVAQGHEHAVVRAPSSGDEHLGPIVLLYHPTVVTPYLGVGRDTAPKGFAGFGQPQARGMTVKRARHAPDTSSVILRQRLMAETDAQEGMRIGHFADEPHQPASLLGKAGTRAEENALIIGQPPPRDGIASDDIGEAIRSLAQELHEVINEGIAIVQY